MNNEDYFLSSNGRPTIIIEMKKSLFEKYYHSKWANLKLFLQEQKSLESAVKLQKQKTIEQFSTKCHEIYKKKIEIQLLTKKNRQTFKSYNSNNDEWQDEFYNYVDDTISKLKIVSELPGSNSIQDFLFFFRQNNNLMLRLIECADYKQFDILVPFLCHFFYENFFMESTEQEEILYIIFLLLEKEIDKLYTPSVSAFLDKSFVGKFLTEMGNRYEIKHYIDITLNYLLRNLEETNITYNSLDIIGISNNIKSEEGKLYYDMSNEDGNLHYDSKSYVTNKTVRNESIRNIQVDGKLPIVENKVVKKSVYVPSSMIKNNGKLELNKSHSQHIGVSFKKALTSDLFNNINEEFIKDKIEKETDEIMQHFYVIQLCELQASRNPNLFNGSQYYEKMKMQKKIYKTAINQFNKSYISIINFINELLTNLENDSIVPYSIKVICKFIYILLQKRFKKISKFQCNMLICQFLFGKLIFPVLQNPDINDAGKDMIISFNTRKTLSDIYIVCKKLVRGELFSIEDKDYLVIFNKFIINNFHRINNIIDKLIHVKAPEKLMKLSEEFYKNENFHLENVQRSDLSINYDYFKENPHDFMQHKSICFSKDELNLFYNIVNNNKEKFIKEGSPLEKIYENLSKDITTIEESKYNYYVIISDDYVEEVRELLFHKDKKMALGKSTNTEDIIENIKYCIGNLISKIEISPNWKWVNDNSDTFSTFKFIHNYLISCNFDNKTYMKDDCKVPLSWYSLYIINNLKKIKNEVGSNDYKFLYDILELEITSKLKKLRRLNEFLTINMTTKFMLIDHKIKIFNQELENVTNTELNIKTVQFIEKTKIKVCLTNKHSLNQFAKITNINLSNHNMDSDSPYKLTLVKRNKKKQVFCIHQAKIEKKKYKILKEKKKFKDCHSKSIKKFCKLLANHFCEIYRNESINVFKENSPKEIVENYMKFLNDAMQRSPIFSTGFNAKKIENDKKKALHIIWNYILKTICIKIFENKINEEDKSFTKVCEKLSWVQPENLEIPLEVYDENLFKKAEEHIKKMDNLRTPGGMLDQFGLGVQFINSMFVFMLNQSQAEAGDLLPLIIFGIIKTKPKRMIFNIKFIKYFMNQNELLGNVGYNLIQAESSTNFIKTITGKQLKMDEKEFEEKCKSNMESIEEDKNKINININSINDLENETNNDDSD